MRETATTLREFAVRRRPDAELVDAAIAGDPAAFAEIYRRHHTPVYAFCFSRLLSPTAAEDAAQETFMRLFSAKPGTIEKPLSWLFGVARHVCIDVARRQNREFASDVATRDLPDPFSTEGHVTARDDAERIAIALGSLNPRYRTALVMHEMHAQSALDIAKAFKIGLGATYTLLSRARDAFSAAYERTERLPEACRRANAMLYRRAAQSTTDAENARLERHLSECDSCRREARRFARSERAAALRGALVLPLTSPVWTRFQHWAEPVVSRLGADATHVVAASVAVTLAAAGLVAVVSNSPPQRAGLDAATSATRAYTAAVPGTAERAQTAADENAQLMAHRRQRAAESSGDFAGPGGPHSSSAQPDVSSTDGRRGAGVARATAGSTSVSQRDSTGDLRSAGGTQSGKAAETPSAPAGKDDAAGQFQSGGGDSGVTKGRLP